MPLAPPIHRPCRPDAAAARLADRRRPNANQRGYTYSWSAARALFLAEFPLCRHCLDIGVVRAATVVDHIDPHRGDKRKFWRRANWQSLCETCHNRKTGSGL
ncbi:MAG: HNH endonuclease [Hyphomonadaceae bacterium]|nr:HNH endonuclease [Hyphomonadaceae bacterium]